MKTTNTVAPAVIGDKWTRDAHEVQWRVWYSERDGNPFRDGREWHGGFGPWATLYRFNETLEIARARIADHRTNGGCGIIATPRSEYRILHVVSAVEYVA